MYEHKMGVDAPPRSPAVKRATLTTWRSDTGGLEVRRGDDCIAHIAGDQLQLAVPKFGPTVKADTDLVALAALLRVRRIVVRDVEGKSRSMPLTTFRKTGRWLPSGCIVVDTRAMVG